MAGNARADEREQQGQGAGAPAGREASADAPRVTPANPEPAVVPGASHEASAGARTQDDSQRGQMRDARERATSSDDEQRPRSPSDIQDEPTAEAAAHRAAPHGAQTEPDGAAEAPELGRNPEVEEAALPPHEPGSMDISVHEATYHRFIGIVIRAVIAIFVVLLLLALLNA